MVGGGWNWSVRAWDCTILVGGVICLCNASTIVTLACVGRECTFSRVIRNTVACNRKLQCKSAPSHAMHPFATYVLRSYYKATGWNEDNLYANLTRSSSGQCLTGANDDYVFNVSFKPFLTSLFPEGCI